MAPVKQLTGFVWWLEHWCLEPDDIQTDGLILFFLSLLAAESLWLIYYSTCSTKRIKDICTYTQKSTQENTPNWVTVGVHLKILYSCIAKEKELPENNQFWSSKFLVLHFHLALFPCRYFHEILSLAVTSSLSNWICDTLAPACSPFSHQKRIQ